MSFRLHLRLPPQRFDLPPDCGDRDDLAAPDVLHKAITGRDAPLDLEGVPAVACPTYWIETS